MSEKQETAIMRPLRPCRVDRVEARVAGREREMNNKWTGRALCTGSRWERQLLPNISIPLQTKQPKPTTPSVCAVSTHKYYNDPGAVQNIYKPLAQSFARLESFL